MLVRALAYILAHGGPGLRNATMDAVLNANLHPQGLEPYYDLPYKSPNMHEVVFSDDRQAKLGVRTGDIAKRLIDYGFHPYTVSFPLIVHGALMIEPTETEGKLELDLFIDAMISIAKEIETDPQMVQERAAQHPHQPRGRSDRRAQAGAAMEARVDDSKSPAVAVLWALVLLIRLPFLNQAIQGDDHIYLTEAQHALIDPLHPERRQVRLPGRRGRICAATRIRPGMPGRSPGCCSLFGDVKEVPFHAAYIVFSLIAVWAMWSLARRFSPRPLWATLLFIAVPAFVVNGNSLETDLPFLAFWMASIALFLSRPPAARRRSPWPPPP